MSCSRHVQHPQVTRNRLANCFSMPCGIVCLTRTTGRHKAASDTGKHYSSNAHSNVMPTQHIITSINMPSATAAYLDEDVPALGVAAL